MDGCFSQDYVEAREKFAAAARDPALVKALSNLSILISTQTHQILREYANQVDMEWAPDRSRLWNAVEHAGRRWNARLAREILVHVPPELAPARRVSLVRTFSQELAVRYRNAVDFAVHVPRALR